MGESDGLDTRRKTRTALTQSMSLQTDDLDELQHQRTGWGDTRCCGYWADSSMLSTPHELGRQRVVGAELDLRLPKWAQQHLVPEKSRKLLKDHPGATMREHCGPGVWYAHLAISISMLMAICFFALASVTTSCSSRHVATYPMTIWLLAVVFIPFLIFLEIKAVGFTLVPYLSCCPPQMPLAGEVSFGSWFAFSMGMSCFNHIVSLNEALFAATAFREDLCDEELQTIWMRTMNASILHRVSCMRPFIDHFRIIVLVFWASTFLHQLWAIPETLRQPRLCGLGSKASHTALSQDSPKARESGPQESRLQDSGLQEFGPQKHWPRLMGDEQHVNDFSNMYCASTTVGDALYSGGEGAHMASIQCQALWYPAARLKELELAMEDESGLGTVDPQRRADIRVGVLTYVRHMLVRVISRVLFGGVFRAGLQLNLCITMLAVRISKRRALKSNVTSMEMFQAVMFAVIALVAMSAPLGDSLWALRFWWHRRYWLNHDPAEDPEVPEQHNGQCSLGTGTRIIMSFWTICLSVLTMLGLFAYALAKLVAALVCDHGMWTLTGCVEL